MIIQDKAKLIYNYITVFQNNLLIFFNNFKASLLLSFPELFLGITILTLLVFVVFFSNYNINKGKSIVVISRPIINVLILIYLFTFTFFIEIQIPKTEKSDLVIFFFDHIYLYYKSYEYSKTIIFSKLFINIFTLLFLFVLRDFLKKKKIKNCDFLLFIPFCSMGINLLLSSNDFLLFYLAIELMALSLYSIVASLKNSRFSTEAALKYFILGSFSSGLLLLGISILYWRVGSVNFSDINIFLVEMKNLKIIKQDLGIIVAFLFIISSILFKIGVAPFHLWIPDIYSGSSLITTMFLSIVPKITYAIILMKIWNSVFSCFYEVWEFFFILVGFMSIILGIVGAFYQVKIKRLLAYSSITNMGFLFLIISLNNLSSVVFFLFVYSLLMINLFSSFLSILNSQFKLVNKINNLRNLLNNNFILSIIIGFSLLSISGLPPLLGFFGKLIILNNLFYNKFVILGILISLISIIGSFYYLRIFKLIFFENSSYIMLLRNIEFSSSFIISFTFLINLFFIIFMPKIMFILDYLVI